MQQPGYCLRTLYKNIIALRPEWNEIRIAEEGAVLSEKDKREIKPMERIKLIMTRSQDDPEEMYNLIGTKENRKELDRQFKNEKSNFKIAIVVDMWLTGFDVPFLGYHVHRQTDSATQFDSDYFKS